MKEFIDTLPTAFPALIATIVLIALLGLVVVGGFIVTVFRDVIGNLLSFEGLLIPLLFTLALVIWYLFA